MQKSILHRRWSFVIGILLSASSIPVATRAAESTASKRPNILLCLADDWSWPHAGVYGDTTVQTPNIDRVAKEGVLFTHAFAASPSCTASDGAILTGQTPHRLEEGANLYGFLPKQFLVYPDLMENAGYIVGMMRKGWGPGDYKAGGRTRNPAGPAFRTFPEFFRTLAAGKPFCFWFGSHDPHRPYDKGFGLRSGLKLEEAVVPPFLPDTPEVRSDMLDYYVGVQRFDREIGQMLKLLENAGQLENTLVVITSDNGWPFPRGKANLYDAGAHVPLIVRWPAKFKAGPARDDFISLSDLAPTFLEAAGLKPLPEMTGRSLLGLLMGDEKSGPRGKVFLERERHFNVRKGDLGYPARAVRTKEFLYIRNLEPDRWPAGDPEMWKAVGPFGDCDNSPTKEWILAHRATPPMQKFFDAAFAKRPADELYDLSKDPHQLTNVVDQPAYAETLQKLRVELDRWMTETKDPRATGGGDGFDRYPYVGDAKKMRIQNPARPNEEPEEVAPQ